MARPRQRQVHPWTTAQTSAPATVLVRPAVGSSIMHVASRARDTARPDATAPEMEATSGPGLPAPTAHPATPDGPSNDMMRANESTHATGPPTPVVTPPRSTAQRFASPPITLRRSRPRGATWTIGEFLTAATKNLSSILPVPGKRLRRLPLNFSPRKGRSMSSSLCTAAAPPPPTAEHRAQVQVLRALGILGLNQKILK